MRRTAVGLLAMCCTAFPALAEKCATVTVNPGAPLTLRGKTSTSVEEPTCFVLNIPTGQRLHLKLLRPASPGLGFNVVGLVDSQDDYSFVAARPSYRIDLAMALARSPITPFVLSVSAAGGEQGAVTDPSDVVSAVLMADTNPTLFAEKLSPLMRKYFTSNFVAIWAKAMRASTDGPILDGDPVSGFQSVKSLTPKSLKSDLASGEQGKVTASVMVNFTDGSPPKPIEVRFDMRNSGGTWKIQDISNDAQASLQTYLAHEIRTRR